MIRRKSDKRRRTVMLTLRVTEDELEAIQMRARIHGCSVSELLRSSALAAPTTWVKMTSPTLTTGTTTTTVASYMVHT